MTGILYIVSTPIGNLQDITVRAMDVLGKVPFIACEDTRRTGILLKHIEGILPPPAGGSNTTNKPKLISYYEQNEERRIPEIINILKEGKDIALVSDAGTPTISDPGFKLVRECIKESIKVESIPGPSSVLAALTSSGLPTDKFLFLGFLPKKQGHRKKLLQNVASMIRIIEATVIFFEGPHRLLRTLEELEEIFGEIDIVLARELTKIHEEVIRGKISEVLKRFENKNPRGEFVVLLNTKTSKEI